MKTKRGNEIKTSLYTNKNAPKWYKGLIRVMYDQDAKKEVNVVYKNMKHTAFTNRPSQIIQNNLLTLWQPLRFSSKPVKVVTTYELSNLGKNLLQSKKRILKTN